jgi:hypothetical protein
MMDGLHYQNTPLQQTVGGKIAIIDSGNTSIQIPDYEYEIFIAAARVHDPTIHEISLNS